MLVREGRHTAKLVSSGFTPKEREVLYLVAKGLNNFAIAGFLGITSETVKTHISAIYRKNGDCGEGHNPRVWMARKVWNEDQ